MSHWTRDEMRLLRTCCVCQCRRSNSGSSSSSSNAHRKRRRRRTSPGSERESVSGSETGVAEPHRTEAVDQRANSRRTNGGGSKRRQRATYRYEVVYRREEFSHDYLDRPEVEENGGHVPPVFRPVPEGQPTDSQALQLQSQVVPFQSADYSLLSNYGRLEEFHPPALHTAVHSWQQQRQPQQHSSHDDQPLYQNFGGTVSVSLPFFFLPLLPRRDWHHFSFLRLSSFYEENRRCLLADGSTSLGLLNLPLFFYF